MLCLKERCTACCACFASCPVDAITMVENELGELKPKINEEKCISCGKCSRACPVLNNKEKRDIKDCFALCTNNENDRKTCSSGGIATALGRYVLKQNGAAFGVAWDGNIVTFKKAEDESELEQFKGSKYVYAFPNKIYRTVSETLTTGKLCIFVGTPCQIDGLQTYLDKEYDNLITVDLICHGTPPMVYLQEYIGGMKLKEKTERVTFRGKRDFYFTAYNADGEMIYSKKQNEDVYFEAFLTGLIHRDICYSCSYAESKRISDITIGDFWGLEQGSLDGYMGKVSVALVNSEKGRWVLKEASDRFKIEKHEISEAIKGNPQLKKPSIMHPERKKFINGYCTDGFLSGIKMTSIKKQVKKAMIYNRVLFLPRRIKRWIKSV